ncbi:GerAB/ArcD/ProY family transporter [Acetivibrio cellulolyticus]|uniref:GerAB/ArcD/ProY family transporter n=1 Tax=Acetivibrio cellulolyticus TaxID=35830 RepID=UPI0001E2C257|nr:GerAB/ArcD/ProY family transporter [Acetivibrio cellulolyticus]
MLASKEKISIRQAMIILLCVTYSPTMRFVAFSGVEIAKQAAWISPIISFVIVIPIVLMLHSIYKKHENQSFTEVMEDILGSAAGKIVTVFYAVFLTFLFSTTSYINADKLVATVYPNQNIMIFIAIVLFTAAFITRKGGIVVIARISEIIFMLLVSIFLFILVLALKDINISRLTPISYLDIYPAFKANIEILGVWSYLPLIFLFSNYINNKEKIKKACTLTLLSLTLLTILMFVVAIGLLGASILELSPVPYVTAVKQISVFQVLERLEAAEIGLWILADFILSAILLFTALNVFKSLFKLSDIRPLAGIYSVIIFLLALMTGRNVFEVQFLGYNIISLISTLFGFIIPGIVFSVGKVRRKI